MVVDSEFSVLLWSKALVLDLDQAEQKRHFLPIFCFNSKLSKVTAIQRYFLKSHPAGLEVGQTLILLYGNVE